MTNTFAAITVHELNHIALYVRDLDTAMHFYGTVLNLPLLPRPAFGFPGAWYALGAQELHLIVDTENQNNPRHSVHFALKVDDVVVASEYLRSMGITEIHGPVHRPDGAKQIFFHDPDGYQLEMVSYPREVVA